MEALEAILTRRSVRKFTSEPVPDGIMRKLLAAGMAAPSAGNQQPWHFVVIDDVETLRKIPGINANAGMAAHAPAAILVCSEVALERYKGYSPVDCSAATQNILLAAHALGCGAVWTGVYPVQERIGNYRRLLHIPEGILPIALIVVGRAAEQPEQEDRFNESRIHSNVW